MTRRRSDTALLVVTGVCVGGLALIAGAISFAHMRELAADHSQSGWKSFAFPISVDGLEIVASLYLLAQRRAGRPTGWIPWVALVVGTLASLSANIGVGGADLIGKALAGWPALSMLVSVKLLFSMFDHAESGDQLAVRDDQRPSALVPAVPAPSRPIGPEGAAPSGTASTYRADERAASATRATGPGVSADRLVDTDTHRGQNGTPDSRPPARRADRSDSALAVDIRSVSHLIPAARAAHAALTHARLPVSRDALAATMRDDGHSVSNAHASTLLKILKSEAHAATPHRNPAPVQPMDASDQH